MAEPFVISMKFVADQRAGVAGVAEVKREVVNLGAAFDVSRTKATELQRAVDQRAASAGTAAGYRGTVETIRAEQQLEAQRLSAQISETGRNQSLARLAQLGRDAAAATKSLAVAEAEVVRTETAISQSASAAAVAVQRLADQQERVASLRSAGINSNLGVRDDFGTASRGADIEAYGQELDALRARYNPLFTAQQRNLASLQEINNAYRRGAITAAERVAAIRTEEAAYARLTTQIEAGAQARMRGSVANDNGMGGFQTANIAAQFQDIAVTSAMGMSPLQIALQQGTQISAAFGNMGAAGAVKTLGAAFLSIISPVSLVTIGLVAGGAAAIQYFSGLGNGAQDADERLDEHLERIKELAGGYDDATKAAEDYVEESRRQPEASVASNLSADQQAALKEVDTALQAIIDKQAEIGFDMLSWQSARTLHADLIQAAAGLDQLGLSADSVQADIDAVHTRLTDLARDDAAPEQARQYARDLLELIKQLNAARTEVGSFGEALNNLPSSIAVKISLSMEGYNAARGDLLDLMPDLRDRFTRARDEAKELFGEQRAAATDSILREQAERDFASVMEGINRAEAQDEAKRAGRASREVSAYERQIDAIRERTAAQQLETNVVGLSTFAQEKARTALELQNAAMEDAIGLSPARIAQIEEEASAYATAAVQQEQLREAQQAFEEQMEFGRGVLRGLFGDLKEGLSDGVLGWDDLGNAGANALDRIADRALGMAADGIFDMIFGAVMGGITGGFGGNPLSLGAGGAGFLGGGAAAWGSFDTGGWTGGTRGQVRGAVHGEEFVVRAGPAAQHRQLLENINSGGTPAAGGGGGGGVTLAPVYNFIGSGFTEAQARRLMQDNNRELMRELPATLADAQRRAIGGSR